MLSSTNVQCARHASKTNNDKTETPMDACAFPQVQSGIEENMTTTTSMPDSLNLRERHAHTNTYTRQYQHPIGRKRPSPTTPQVLLLDFFPPCSYAQPQRRLPSIHAEKYQGHECSTNDSHLKQSSPSLEVKMTQMSSLPHHQTPHDTRGKRKKSTKTPVRYAPASDILK